MSDRIVRTDITTAQDPKKWKDVIPQHEKDLLQWTSALKVPHYLPFDFQVHLAMVREQRGRKRKSAERMDVIPLHEEDLLHWASALKL